MTENIVGLCHKCGTPVRADDNAPHLDEILGAPPAAFFEPRHIMPVIVGEKQICEGSPSRRQYLPDQPKDSRPFWRRFKFIPAMAPKMLSAYAELQKRTLQTQ